MGITNDEGSSLFQRNWSKLTPVPKQPLPRNCLADRRKKSLTEVARPPPFLVQSSAKWSECTTGLRVYIV